MKIGKIVIVLLCCALALTACGGGTDPRPDVFNEENAWTGSIPEDAEIITPNEFARMLDTGEVSLTNDALMAESAAQLEERFDANVETLQQASDLPPALQEVLDALVGVDDYAGDVATQLPSGDSVVLEGLGTLVEGAVRTYQQANDVDNALTDYAHTYLVLPDDIKSQVPTPESLAGASLEAVLAALHDIDVALANNSVLTSARAEAFAIAPGGGVIDAAAIQPGVGNDQDAACTQPTGIAAEYWFPLKNFISPIKNQANRGTCWAFTAIGAIESRERVQNANPVNLSEQFLVNKVKEDWDESDFTDGYWSDRALNTAVDEGQQLPSEGAWTYNPAPNRDANLSGNAAAYAGTCNPYGVGPNAGTCSDTAHQSRRVCSTFIFTVCGYATVTFGGPGIASSNAYQLWANGQSFDLNRYRMLLSQGYVIMASFPVYKGFMDDVTSTGVVSNYAKTRIDAAGNEVAGSYGGHAVQIVGFIDNSTMSKPGRTPVNIGGGGFFIIKNSWGCNAGDGGYYYVPADYVSQLFTSLHVMNFDMRRSAAWTAEQTTPGGSEAPTISIFSSPALVDLRVSTNIATFFRVAHPVAKSVTLKISSSGLGTLYDGPWSTDKDALFGPIFNYTFQQAGDRYLTLEARYGTSVRTTNLLVRVVNSAPTVTLEFSGNAYVGEAYAFSAKVADKNETDVGALCSRTTWSVSGSDVLSASSGCQVSVTFGSEGTRAVTATTKDAENQVTSKTANVFVYPARPNPYPIISTSGVYRRDSAYFNGQFIGCIDYAVATGTLITLSDKGCTLTGVQPQRYSGQVEVENPSGEALTYTFRLYVESGTQYEQLYISLLDSPEPYFELYNRFNSGPGPGPCHVTVTVNAPETSRSKTATIWTGQCYYYSFQLN
jgi:hypothetical protein